MLKDESPAILKEQDLAHKEIPPEYSPPPPPREEQNMETKSNDISDEEGKEHKDSSSKTPSTIRRESPTHDILTETADKFQKNFSSSKAFGDRGIDQIDTTEPRDAPKAQDAQEPFARSDTSTPSPYSNSEKNYPIVTTPGQSISDMGNRKKTRGEWGNHCEYFLTSLGLAVGLGNIWRFPFQVYENGGSTFMIPYFIMLFLVGLPMFFMEMVLGQYSGTSSTKIYARLAPGLKGLGYGMLAIPTIINFYYTVIMAWAFFYMFSGFTDELPWKFCGKEYNSITCFTHEEDLACSNVTIFWNNTCTDVEVFCNWHNLVFVNDDFENCYNGTANKSVPITGVTKRVSAAEDFFTKRMLKIGEVGVESTWENYGDIQWEIVGCLALSWILICLSLIKGVESYGKVVYFITLFPYVVLVTLLIVVSMEDGFKDGIEFYMLNPDWDRLGNDINVWMNAASQIFYSLGIAVGSQLLLASYNDFNSNCHRDAILIGLFNSLTSVFGGFVVFGITGVLAYKNDVPIEEVVESGTGLAFIAYPDAVAQMPVSPLFSFMFFFMLVLLALSSIAATWEPTVAAIIDEFPYLHKYRPYVMILSCVIAFLCGVSCCFESGMFMFDMMDNRTANAIVIVGFVEMIVLWCYGLDRFFDNIKEMKIWMPTPMKWFWKSCWGLFTPGIVFVVMLNSYINHVPDHYQDYTYPANIQVLGWFLELSPVVFIFLVSIGIVIYNYFHGGDMAFLRAGPLMTPTASWGPREDRPRSFDPGADNIAYYLDVPISTDIQKTTL